MLFKFLVHVSLTMQRNTITIKVRFVSFEKVLCRRIIRNVSLAQGSGYRLIESIGSNYHLKFRGKLDDMLSNGNLTGAVLMLDVNRFRTRQVSRGLQFPST